MGGTVLFESLMGIEFLLLLCSIAVWGELDL